MSLPTVSAVIPTLNAEKYFDECLAALRAQDYPFLEIVVADAGSTDATLAIAHRHGVDRVVENPLLTAEAGKAAAIRAATGELILSVDSDNVVVGTDWLRRMVAPLVEDPAVISSEALRWDYRREDHFINRYQALTGINDPLALYIGNYDRVNRLTGRWTDCPYRSEPRDGWEHVTLDPAHVPTMGANGYLVRRSAFDVVELGDHLFDIDFVHDLVQAGHRTIARVDVPIRHYFCDGVWRFYRKTRRRTADYHYHAARGERSYPWTERQRRGIVRFVLATVLVVPLLVTAWRGWRLVRDPAWLFHVPACWITLAVYAYGVVKGRVAPRQLDRTDWSQ